MDRSRPSNFILIESCLKCEHRDSGLFCNLPESALHRLMASREARVYPKGALICQEGQPAKGVFVLCTGRAQISTTTPEGKTTVLREAEPGEILGISAVLSGTPYKTTAEVMEQCQLNFVEKEEFLRMVQEDTNVGAHVVDQILHDCGHACEELSVLEVSGSVDRKIAQLLLRWARHPRHVLNRKRNEVPIKVSANHEEIAHMINATAAEVGETLRTFQRKKWLTINGQHWSIMNMHELEETAGDRNRVIG